MTNFGIVIRKSNSVEFLNVSKLKQTFTHEKIRDNKALQIERNTEQTTVLLKDNYCYIFLKPSHRNT